MAWRKLISKGTSNSKGKSNSKEQNLVLVHDRHHHRHGIHCHHQQGSVQANQEGNQMNPQRLKKKEDA